MMIDLPKLALSVRQPWTYGIVFEGKDIENRSWNARFSYGRAALDFRGPVCMHASKGMTRDEYEGAAGTFRAAGAHLPAAAELLRGGIIGVVEIVDVVRKSRSPWFYGPVGLVLANPRPVEFIPCDGQLGFFEWQRSSERGPMPPARWMLPAGRRPETRTERQARQGDLL